MNFEAQIDLRLSFWILPEMRMTFVKSFHAVAIANIWALTSPQLDQVERSDFLDSNNEEFNCDM